jgi:hypothetical protein
MHAVVKRLSLSRPTILKEERVMLAVCSFTVDVAIRWQGIYWSRWKVHRRLTAKVTSHYAASKRSTRPDVGDGMSLSFAGVTTMISCTLTLSSKRKGKGFRYSEVYPQFGDPAAEPHGCRGFQMQECLTCCVCLGDDDMDSAFPSWSHASSSWTPSRTSCQPLMKYGERSPSRSAGLQAVVTSKG